MSDTHAHAAERARAVRDRLDNPDTWRVRVYKNYHWEWILVCGPLILYESCVSGTFACVLVSNPDHVQLSGGVHWTPTKFFSDPNKAVQYTLKSVSEFLKKLKSRVSAKAWLENCKKLAPKTGT